MNYISDALLGNHMSVISDINELIEECEGTPEAELYKILVQSSFSHISQVFGERGYTLNSISNLIHSLNHWVTDDGEYSIVRKVNERRSTLNKRLGRDGEDTLQYDYSIMVGDGDEVYESCYATVEDMLNMFSCLKTAKEYYNQHKNCIEGFNGDGERQPYLERREKDCYKTWSALEGKGEKYLEEMFKERYEE